MPTLIFLARTLRKPTDLFVLAFALGLIIPMKSLYGLADKPRFVMYSVFEYFSTDSFVFRSNSLTSAFVDYPYHTNAAELSGEWKGTFAHTSSTFTASTYKYGDLLGLILYRAVVGLFSRD